MSTESAFALIFQAISDYFSLANYRN